MAADFIDVNRTEQPGNTLVALAGRILEIQEEITNLFAAGNHMHESGNYALLESNFGLAAGKGANTLTLLGYMNEIFNTATDVAGATRLSRIQEFTSRLFPQ
jgi:hypothetical protein